MELKEFVSQSLLQIFQGLNQAKDEAKDIGGSIGAIVPTPNNNNSYTNIIGYTQNYKPVTLIDFDILLNTVDENKSKAGAGLFVAALGIGAQSGSVSSNNQFNRLRFSVPVVLP
jgi:hypothetical protein